MNKRIMKKSVADYLILAILVLAFLLRFWGVGGKEMIGDEATYAFRAVGYLDYLGTNFQTQPIDWYKDKPLPSWTKLSFHDHPPLVFLTQNLFFRIFGDSALTARLPGIIFGTASVFLLYILTKMLFGGTLALFASFIFAVNSAVVGLSRTALMESILLFLILLNIYLFFSAQGGSASGGKVLESADHSARGWKWWFWGISLGLVFLTKYTGFFLVSVYVVYLLLKNRKIFKDWRFYAAILLAIIIFSPVIIYNVNLYKERGHFDLQISYLLGQNTPEWTGLLGKEQAPFSDIWKNLAGLFGIPFLIVVWLGILVSIPPIASLGRGVIPHIKLCVGFIRKYSGASLFLWIYIIFLSLMLIRIGMAARFLVLYAPIFAILISLAIRFLWSFKNRLKISFLFKFLAAAFIVFEIYFSINTNFIQAADYGMVKLDKFFSEEFKNKRSAIIPQTDNVNFNEIIKKFAKNIKGKNDLSIIIYNDNVAMPTLQWVFYRRFFYHSVPAFFIENFIRILNQEGEGYFKGMNIYFVQSVKNAILNPFKADKVIGDQFEENLKSQGLIPIRTIYGHNNLEMFRVYKFSI